MRIHPLMAGAAAGVIVLSGVGVAAITGVLPRTQAEKAAEQPVTKHYEVRVQMGDGKLRTVKFAAQPAWKSGDKVRLQDGKLVSA